MKTMTEPLKRRWPLEAHPRPDEGMAYRLRVAERVSALLQEADWRYGSVERACEILERAVAVGFEQRKVDFDPVAEALRQANLVQDFDPAAKLDGDLARLMIDSIVGEATGLLLYRNTSRDAWTLGVGLWPHFNNMLAALRTFLE